MLSWITCFTWFCICSLTLGFLASIIIVWFTTCWILWFLSEYCLVVAQGFFRAECDWHEVSSMQSVIGMRSLPCRVWLARGFIHAECDLAWGFLHAEWDYGTRFLPYSYCFSFFWYVVCYCCCCSITCKMFVSLRVVIVFLFSRVVAFPYILIIH